VTKPVTRSHVHASVVAGTLRLPKASAAALKMVGTVPGQTSLKVNRENDITRSSRWLGSSKISGCCERTRRPPGVSAIKDGMAHRRGHPPLTIGGGLCMSIAAAPESVVTTRQHPESSYMFEHVFENVDKRAGNGLYGGSPAQDGHVFVWL
jgi:hypothetical protein